MKEQLKTLLLKHARHLKIAGLVLGLGLLSRGGQLFAQANYEDGLVDGCTTLIKITVNPLAFPSCELYNDKLVVVVGATGEVFDATTGEKINE